MSRASAVLVSVLLAVCAAASGCSGDSSPSAGVDRTPAHPASAQATDPSTSPVPPSAVADAVVLDLDPIEELRRRKGRLEVRGEWGSGPRQFGLYRPSRRGPTSFDVTAGGGVVIVDQQNRRIVLREKAQTTTLVTGIRPLFYDVAADDRALHVLAINGGVGGADTLQSFRISDGSVIGSTSAGDDADAIRVVAGDLYVHSFSHDWTLASGADSPGRPEIATEDGGEILLEGGRGRSVTIIKSDAAGSASWRLTSAEHLGVVAVTASVDGVRAVLVRWTDTSRSYQYVDLGPSGLLETFQMPDHHFAEMTAGAEFRFHGDSLYRAASTRRGFRIYRYLGRGRVASGDPSPEAGKTPSDPIRESTSAGVDTAGEPAHARVHALFHRHPNFASNSICRPVSTVARRLRTYGFEVSIHEVPGAQPSNIVTDWRSGGARGSVSLTVGGDNPSCFPP